MRRNALPLLLIILFSWLLLSNRSNSSPEARPSADEPAVTESAAAAAPETADGEDAADASEAGSDAEEAEDQKPLLRWRGESPRWVPGQEFAAVVGAPFIGSSECVLCHEGLKTDFLHTAHARTLTDPKAALDRQGCEMCHGAGGAHAVLRSRGAIFGFDWQDPKPANDICLRCHSWLTSGHEWVRTTHAKAGLSCIQCHDPHQPQGQRNERWLLPDQQDRLCVTCHKDVGHEFSRFSHHPVRLDLAVDSGASAMHCTSCHDVHAGKERAMLPERHVAEVCASCHADKAGPFRFEHMGAQAGMGQSCLQCHAQHGSHSESLLLADGRALCMQCHTDRETHYQPLTCWTSGCHTDVHGSNHSLLLLGEQVGAQP